MHIIDIAIRNKIAVNTNKTEYVCGNDDFIVRFDFDAEWDDFVHKTARFISNGAYVDVVFSGNECQMPIHSNTNTILCGVYAGDLRTTTPALIGARKSILCGSPAPAEPHPDVYAQMVALFNAGLDESRQNTNATATAKTAAETAQKGAEEAKAGAEKAKAAVEGMTFTGETVEHDSTEPAVEKTMNEDGTVNLHLKLRQGKTGKKPEKGVDYWTDADKQEIVNMVMENFTDVSEVGM